MTNQEIVGLISASGIVEDIARNIRVTGDYYDDFVQEMYLTLMDYDNGRLNEIFGKGQIKYFTARVCINNWSSKTSPFYCKYKRPFTHVDANASLDKISDKI